jgi:hypothetical protein
MPRPSFRPGLFALGVAVAVLATLTLDAGPAAAGASHRPDGRIKIDCTGVVDWRMCPDTWTGAGIYNQTAKNQKVVWDDYFDYATEPDPRVVWFNISMRNAGSVSDRFRVNADGISSGYNVNFFRGSTKITSAVEAGTYLTPRLAPGETFLIRAKVAMPCEPTSDCGQDRASRLVTVRSHADPAVADAVKFVRKRWVCTC